MATKTITATFTLNVPEGQDMPDGVDIAVYLDCLLGRSNADEPDPYTLTDPTVFMEPVTAVVDMTGGCFHCAHAEIPMDVIVYDAEASEDYTHELPERNMGGEFPAWVGVQSAELSPGWVAHVVGNISDPSKAIEEGDED